MKKYILPFVLLLFVASQTGYGQGCSDAGFCTLNSLKPQSSDSAHKAMHNQLKVGVSFGGADHGVSTFGSYLEYNRQLSKTIGVDIRLSYLSQSSSLLTTSGLADVFVSGRFNVAKNALITAGLKLPLQDGNTMENGQARPMDFQNSLGTTDLILGFSTAIKKLQLSAAIQQPLTQNKNTFLSTNFSPTDPYRQFQSTNMYDRKGDVLLRISYPLYTDKKWSVTPSLLPIYHLGEDAYTDLLGSKRNIVGSDGLTLNGTIFVEHRFNQSNKLEASFGAPFVTRTVRPDGLTRQYVFTLEYKFLF